MKHIYPPLIIVSIHLYLVALLSVSCGRLPVVTVQQPHVISRIDTIGKHLRIHLVPVANPRSIYGRPFHPGDTLPVLKLQKFRL